MKRILSALIALWSVTTMAGLPPTTLSGQSATTKPTTFNFKTPYNQATNTPSGGLIETGNPNVLPDPGLEAATTSWTVYKNTTPAAIPEVSPGGTPSGNLTVSNSTSSPLDGARSLLLVKTGSVSVQGEGIKIPFTIPVSSTYKVNRLSFDYGVASGTYADDQIEFFVRDVTNGTVKPFTPSKLKNHTLVSDTFAPNGEFQASNSTSYELIAHVAGTSASNYSLKFDNFKLGVYEKTYGSTISDWVSYTPTISASAGSTSSVVFKYRKVGDSIEIIFSFTMGASPTGGAVTFTIPSGLTAKEVNKLMGFWGGQGSVLNSGLSTSSSTAIQFDASNWQVGATGTQMGASSFISGFVKVPIVGWSSSQVMSSDADTRVVSFVGHPASNQSLTASTTNINLLADDDTHGGWSGNSYTVKVPGSYEVKANSSPTTASSILQSVYVDGVFAAVLGSSTGGAYASGSATLKNLKAGQVISFRWENTLTIGSSSLALFSINRLSGPAQIAASETVAAAYRTGAGQSIASATQVTVLYGTKENDSHGSYNTSTGVFTAPVSGRYAISAKVAYNFAPSTAGNLFTIYIVKNGTILSKVLVAAQSTVSNYFMPTINEQDVQLLAGDTIEIKTSHDESTAKNLNTQPEFNKFSIVRVGNY